MTDDLTTEENLDDESEEMNDEDATLGDDVLDEVAGVEDDTEDDEVEGFGLVDEKDVKEDDEEEEDDEEPTEPEEDVEDMDYDSFDDVDEM